MSKIGFQLSLKRLLLIAVLLPISSVTYSEVVGISAVPTAWRLENYAGGSSVVAWFTGSSCTNGLLSFPTTAKESDKNRFWAMVMAAKLTQKTISAQYDNAPGANCAIVSFWMDG